MCVHARGLWRGGWEGRCGGVGACLCASMVRLQTPLNLKLVLAFFPTNFLDLIESL